MAGNAQPNGAAAAPANNRTDTVVVRNNGAGKPSGQSGSLDDAAAAITGKHDRQTPIPRKPAKAANASDTDPDLERAALASLSAEDTPAEGDDGQGDPDDNADDLSQQRDDDAPDEFDDPDPDAQNDDEDEEREFLGRRVKVKVDGKDGEVTVDELRKGYQRRQDYSRKTEELANRGRDLDSHLATVMQQRQALDGLLAYQADAIRQSMGSEPDWVQLSQANPTEYVRIRAEWDQRARELLNAEQLRVRNAQIQQFQSQQQRAAQIAAAGKEMLERNPDWKDPVKGKAARDRLVAYAGTLGYKPEDLATVVDPRHFEILDKAQRYDALIAKARKAPVKPPVQRVADDDEPRAPPVAAPRTATPGTARPPTRPNAERKLQEAKNTLARTGRTEDAAAAIARLRG